VSKRSPVFQLPLAIRPDDSATFANFYAVKNAALIVNELQRLIQDKEHGYLYLCAVEGSGKSHLLQAVVNAAEQSGIAALYLPLKELQHYSPDEIFSSATAFEIIALDDLQTVIADPQWQSALFKFYNDCRDEKRKLLIAADRPVNELDCQLADLRSRLGWGGIFRLSHSDDTDRIHILRHRAAQLGLGMEDDVARFILSRANRDLNELMSILDQLDQASLSQQRKLTIPFIKQEMHW
jgi:DnaA family protein